MAIKAVNAAEKTRRRGCFIAIRAAIKKVLSPISENIIIVRDRRKECRGWIKDPGVVFSRGRDGVKGLRISRGSLFIVVGGEGGGISWGFSGRSAGFCDHNH